MSTTGNNNINTPLIRYRVWVTGTENPDKGEGRIIEATSAFNARRALVHEIGNGITVLDVCARKEVN